MNRHLAITERQMRAIIRAAQKEGAACEVKIGDAVVRVSHDLVPGDAKAGSRPLDRRTKGHL